MASCGMVRYGTVLLDAFVPGVFFVKLDFPPSPPPSFSLPIVWHIFVIRDFFPSRARLFYPLR